jgi:hypothetical protein
MNILILKRKEVEDPMSNLIPLRDASVAATREKWGYIIIKDRFNNKANVGMSHEAFWSYVSKLDKHWK